MRPKEFGFIIFLSPFCRWENQSVGRWSHLSNDTPLVREGDRFQIQALCLQLEFSLTAPRTSAKKPSALTKFKRFSGWCSGLRHTLWSQEKLCINFRSTSTNSEKLFKPNLMNISTVWAISHLQSIHPGTFPWGLLCGLCVNYFTHCRAQSMHLIHTSINRETWDINGRPESPSKYLTPVQSYCVISESLAREEGSCIKRQK